MQRGLSAFDITVIVSELQDMVGWYVEKIYQLTRDELLLTLRQKNNEKESILIRNSQLLCRTTQSFDAPEKPSVFAMTLRKYLLNGTISEIVQYDFDRIITIKIGRKEGDYTVVCELFSNGNIILLNPEGRIIRPLIKQEWTHRIIKTGEVYTPPPAPVNPFTLPEETFQELLKESAKDLVRTLATTMNLSGLYAEELCVCSGLNKNMKAGELDNDSVRKLYQELQNLLTPFREKHFQPTLVKKEGAVIDILPFRFESYQDAEFEPTNSFSRDLQQYITQQKPLKQETSTAQKKREKLQRQIASQQNLIEEFKKDAEERKKAGDLLYLNFQECERLLSSITVLLRQKEKQEGITLIRQNPLVKQFDPTTNDLVVELPDGEGNKQQVPLDFRRSVAENAELMYNESKKIQEKLHGAHEAVLATRHDLESLQDTEVAVQKKETRHEKQYWFERFRWFISTEGNVVVAGRDAKSNDLVVKKYLSEGDRYAHADIHGAPSCVIKNKGIHDEPLPISAKTLKEACCFAASYSKAWNQFGEAQAYWVLPEQVSKTPQSGEFVPKGGFIIRGKRNYHRCSLQVAVGRITIDDTEKLMGGPVDAVAACTEHYVILAPGVTKKTVIAHQLAKVFHASTDAVEKVLPPGNMTIIKTVGVNIS